MEEWFLAKRSEISEQVFSGKFYQNVQKSYLTVSGVKEFQSEIQWRDSLWIASALPAIPDFQLWAQIMSNKRVRPFLSAGCLRVSIRYFFLYILERARKQ